MLYLHIVNQLNDLGMGNKYFWVWVNGAYVARYKSVKACVNYIERNGLANDYENEVGIYDAIGNSYNVLHGYKMD